MNKTLTQHEEFLLDLLQVTIASKSPALAVQTKEVLEVAAKFGECDRHAIWRELTPQAQTKFKEMLTP
jgi:hypothetical protein